MGFSRLWSSSHRSNEQKYIQWFRKIKHVLLPPDPDVKDIVPHYRYTPILPGLIIPFAILLEIPGLISDWYIRTVDNKTVESQPNTPLLNAALGLSLGFGIIANITLILRFLEKHVKMNTIICVIFLTLHDIINIIVIIIFGVEHRYDDGFTYGQSFWMIIASTAVSSITNVTLVVDYFKTPDFAHSGSGLTRKQRSLVIGVMILLTYLAFGAGVNSALLHLDFIDALYFTVTSVETIGFGDISPQTAGSRVFIAFYVVFGALNLGLVIGLARDTVLEALEVNAIIRLNRIRHKRQLLMRKRRVFGKWRNAIMWRLRHGGHEIWVPADTKSSTSTTFKEGSFLTPWRKSTRRHMELNYRALTLSQLQGAAMEAGAPLEKLLPEGFVIDSHGEKLEGAFPELPKPRLGTLRMPSVHNNVGKMIAMLGYFALATSRRVIELDDSTIQVEADERGHPAVVGPEEQLDEFVYAERSEQRAFWAKLLVAWTIFIVFWMVGSVLFMVSESWTFGIAFYFCFVSFSTVGYGDYTPKTPAGRAIFVVWALLGVAALTILISVMSEAYSSRYENVVTGSVFLEEAKHYRFNKAVSKELAGPTKSGRDSGSAVAGVAETGTDLDYAQTPQEKLEMLPQEILSTAQMLREHIHYFTRLRSPHASLEAYLRKDPIPSGVIDLMDEINGDGMHTAMRHEVLKNSETRETLYNISIEDGLTKIIAAAEAAMSAMQAPHPFTMHPYPMNDQEMTATQNQI